MYFFPNNFRMECYTRTQLFTYFSLKMSLLILLVERTSRVLCNSTKAHATTERKVSFKKLS